MTVVRGADGTHPAGDKVDGLPYDLPASLYAERHIKDGGLAGWSLHIQPLSHGDHAIEIKFVHGGPAAIFMDGKEIGRFKR